MNLPKKPLDLAIWLHRKMELVLNDDGDLEGTLPVDIDFTQVLEALDQCSIRGSNDNDLSRIISFSKPPHFYSSMADFLQSANRRISVPGRFYIADLDYVHSGSATEQPEIILYYLAIVELFNNLESIADDVRTLGSDKTLIFLGSKKLEITSEYSEEDLRAQPKLDFFEVEFINSQTHQEQKKSIISKALLNIFSARRIHISEVLLRFDEFLREVEVSYQCFVSEFSFEKIVVA